MNTLIKDVALEFNRNILPSYFFAQPKKIIFSKRKRLFKMPWIFPREGMFG